MTELKRNRLSVEEVVTLRGLRLPPVILKGLHRAGIYCRPAVSIEFHQETQQYLIRGVESGGAVPRIGAYCGFVDLTGLPCSMRHSVSAIGANGLHAAVFSRELVRLHMVRSETRYELSITHHWLSSVDGKRRPKLRHSVLFREKSGSLEMELWSKARQLSGLVAPVFYSRTGDEITPPMQFYEPILRATAGACCCGCRHSHLSMPVSAG